MISRVDYKIAIATNKLNLLVEERKSLVKHCKHEETRVEKEYSKYDGIMIHRTVCNICAEELSWVAVGEEANESNI